MKWDVMPKISIRAWEEALRVHQSEIDNQVGLVESLEHYRDGLSDKDWVVINNAVKVMKKNIMKMQSGHDKLQKAYERDSK